MKENLGFIKMPNIFVWDYTKENKSLIKTNELIPYVYTYLNCREDRLKQIIFNLDMLITSCGKTIQRGKGKSLDSFKNTLKYFQEKEYVYFINPLEDIKPNTIIYAQELKQYNNLKRSYFKIDRDKIIVLLNLETELDKIKLLNLYYYINARLNRRENNNDLQPDIIRDGGRYEGFSDTLETISKDLNISKPTLVDYLKTLQENELIYFGNIGKISKDGKVKTANNIYCINQSELKEGLKQQKLYYMNIGWNPL